MARPERPLDPEAGPVAAFAHDLRLLRVEAGSPSYRRLATVAAYSATALSKAASGDQLPSLEVTLGYVKACGGDSAALEQWRERWERARGDLGRTARDADPIGGQADAAMQPQHPARGRIEAAAPSADERSQSSAPRRRVSRPALAIGLTAGIAVLAVAALLGFTLPGSSAAAHNPPSTQTPATAGVGNPDANGQGVVQAVRHRDPAVLVPGHVIDLDSMATNWADRAGYPHSPYDLEFTLAHHTLVGEDQAVLGILPAGSVGTRHECGSLSDYGVEMSPAQIKPGALFCIITDQNRYALLRITDALYDSTGLPAQVTLDIKVWEPRNAG